ncbi:MAG: nucleotide sugar dehydrogenase [archaeon]
MELEKTVCIVGLGYVGLPLACLSAAKGYSVRGIDLDPAKVKKINSGESPIEDEYLKREVRAQKGKITASTDFASVPDSDFVVVCVPTPVDEKHLPDLRPLEGACRSIAPKIRKGQTIIIESTIYPGTIEEICKPLLEKGSGLKAEKDFYLCHCPERIDPGNKKWTIENIPRVIGGLSAEGVRKAKSFYESILSANVLALNSVKATEAVKITENCFRDVNIAFVNELAQSFRKLGIDTKEVIEGASTKPFGYMPFYPGPGVGGHCISVDPYYLIERAKRNGFNHKFLSLAREINNAMPFHVVFLAQEALNEAGIPLKGAKVAVLGVAYKRNVDDFRESPSFEIISELKRRGAEVRVFDPFISPHSTVPSLESALEGADCIVLATDHDSFVEKLTPEFLKKAGVKAVVDGRNRLDKSGISLAGIIFRGIGR